MVFAFAGDSTMTKYSDKVLPPYVHMPCSQPLHCMLNLRLSFAFVQYKKWLPTGCSDDGFVCQHPRVLQILSPDTFLLQTMGQRLTYICATGLTFYRARQFQFKRPGIYLVDGPCHLERQVNPPSVTRLSYSSRHRSGMPPFSVEDDIPCSARKSMRPNNTLAPAARGGWAQDARRP